MWLEMVIVIVDRQKGVYNLKVKHDASDFVDDLYDFMTIFR